MHATLSTDAQRRERLLLDAYTAFNARDVGGALNVMHPDVNWANGMTGGSVYGHQAVREYWLTQWTEVQPVLVPLRFHHDGAAITAEVVRGLFALDGTLLNEEVTRHRFTFDGWRVLQMEIPGPLPATGDTVAAPDTLVIVETVVVEVEVH